MSQIVAPPAVAKLYSQALLIRAVEQRLLALFSEGKLFGTVHTCIGQEWTGVALAQALRPGDKIFSNHRCHGHFLARTHNVNGLIAEIMGKQAGICGGRGGSQHLCAEGFFSNGIQGGIMPVASGMAFAEKVRGQGHVIVVFIGDGTLGEGTVYESLNLAAKWQLPLLVVLENNLYSQSTAQRQTLSGEILARPAAFGIHTAQANTWDPPELLAQAAHAVDYVRTNQRPMFLCIDTYRLMAHSKSDDDRDPAEVKSYWEKDPLTLFERDQPDTAAAFRQDAKNCIDAAVALAEASPYTTAPEPPAPSQAPLAWSPVTIANPDRGVNLLRAGFRRNLARDPRILFLGEDIESPYGGAYKVTKGLSDEFPGRVRNTPISEALIAGMGNGMALNGLLPVCEFMFGDFVTLALDQIVNHASKFRFMYNNQVRVPVIFRTPMGGKRGYGPTHSQSLEKHLLGIPDVRVLALHHRHDPGQVYDTLFTHIDGPTIVLENKILYTQRASDHAPDGFILEQSDELYPTVRLRPADLPADLTILCYGGMLPDVEDAVQKAFDQHEIFAEVICPTQLYPFDPRSILQSVQASHRLLIVEEGISFAGFGAEIAARIAELAPGSLHSLRRLSSPEHPIPSCGPLEKAVLPHPASILKAIVEIAKNV